MELIRRRFVIESFDKTLLNVYAWHGQKRAQQKGRILLVHGYLEHGARYAPLAATLAERGFEVVVPDLRGHGHSAGARGHIHAFSDYHLDLKSVVDKMDEGLPQHWAVIGHSLGGLVALDCVQQQTLFSQGTLKGLLVTNPYLSPRLRIAPYKRFLGRALSRLIPQVSLPAGIDIHALTSDTAMISAIEQDPLITKRATARWFTQSSAAQIRVLQNHEIDVPLRVILSSADAIADADTTQQWFENLQGPTDRQLDVRAKEMHEVFFERDRVALYHDVADWLVTLFSTDKATFST